MTLLVRLNNSARGHFLPIPKMSQRDNRDIWRRWLVIWSDFLPPQFHYVCVSDGISLSFQARLVRRERSVVSVTTASEKSEFVCHDVCSVMADRIVPMAATKIPTNVVRSFIIIYSPFWPVYRSHVAIGIKSMQLYLQKRHCFSLWLLTSSIFHATIYCLFFPPSFFECVSHFSYFFRISLDNSRQLRWTALLCQSTAGPSTIGSSDLFTLLLQLLYDILIGYFATILMLYLFVFWQP